MFKAFSEKTLVYVVKTSTHLSHIKNILPTLYYDLLKKKTIELKAKDDAHCFIKGERLVARASPPSEKEITHATGFITYLNHLFLELSEEVNPQINFENFFREILESVKKEKFFITYDNEHNQIFTRLFEMALKKAGESAPPAPQNRL